MSNIKHRRRTFYPSIKAGIIHCDSSYEVKAATLLDADESVAFYEAHEKFVTPTGKTRFTDFLVMYKDGRKVLIEIKPANRIEEFHDQIQDGLFYAKSKGYEFAVWTEKELGFNTTWEAAVWADKFLGELKGIDFETIRRDRANGRVMKHYNSKIATNKVTVFCEHCQIEHEALRLTYDKNIARNGRYICEREGGKIAGSLPKLHLRKDNPYLAEGKKQCTKCLDVLHLEEFGDDKSRRDGKASRCRKCRK